MHPRRLARIGGALYLILIAIGLWGEMFVRDRLIVSRDPKTTAANILAHESLWRSHIAAELFLLICATVLLLILYDLLRAVNERLALLMVFFNLVSIAIEAVITLDLVRVLFLLNEPSQLSALLKAHAYGFGVSLLFFGGFCIVIGYLIFKSGFFPKAIGVLMQIAGVCYAINTFALIVSPPLANVLFPAILVPSLIGELSLCLYLLVKGVRS
jgi:hypothetical protein